MSTWAATHPWTDFWVPGIVCWCLLVSVGVCCCPELSRDNWRRWLWAYGWSVCMFMGFGCVLGCFGVFRPCMVQQMLYIGSASKGKTPLTWNLWNIKIPKPPYISSLKIIGLLQFWGVLCPSEENYNLQSLWITLYSIWVHSNNALWEHFRVSKSLEWSPVFKRPKFQKYPRNPKT